MSLSRTPAPETPVEKAARAAEAFHEVHGERVRDCGGLDPAVGADGDLAYCAECSLVLWKPDGKQ